MPDGNGNETKTVSCASDEEGTTTLGMRVRAIVVGNTLVVEDGVPLPEGTRVDVVLRAVEDDSDGWDLSDDEWAEIDESIAEGDRGELIPADVVLAELRALKSACTSTSRLEPARLSSEWRRAMERKGAPPRGLRERPQHRDGAAGVSREHRLLAQRWG